MEDPTIVAAFRAQWGLDRPLPEQYLTYLQNLVRGNFGTYIRTHTPVSDDLARYLPASAELAIIATVVGTLVGIPFGIVSAVRRNQWIDHVVRGVSLLGVSSPVLWLGLISLYVFYYRLRWLPGPGRLDVGLQEPAHITGMYTVDSLLTGIWPALESSVRHLILPGLVLASVYLGLVTRITRSSMLEVLSADYVSLPARNCRRSDEQVCFPESFPEARLAQGTRCGYWAAATEPPAGPGCGSVLPCPHCPGLQHN
jgi:peptide/nickel transport system permease protein